MKNTAERPLPMSRAEMDQRGWPELDVLLISGDAYVDHPSFAAAVIGRVLEAEGLRVGIIAQPDWNDPQAFQILGRPKLFCGISAGNIDSMVNHYTAARHKRSDDSYTENGEFGKRPNRALTVYCQLAKRAFKGLPIIIGGIEASMRRTAHYDYWQDKLRPSILTDSKADLLVFGMGEAPVREIAQRFRDGDADLSGIRSTARLLGGKASKELDLEGARVLPSYEDCQADKKALLKVTKTVEREQNPYCGRPLIQFHGDRAVYFEPPALPPTTEEMDAIYSLPFTLLPHPIYKGRIPAYEMIKDSITVVRGCPGGCSFCGITMHQGKFLTNRSEKSVMEEIERLTQKKDFHGTISDLGGPTANLYGCENGVEDPCRKCRRPSCMHPTLCKNLKLTEHPVVSLMRHAREADGVKHVHVSSGIRMEVALKFPNYIDELVQHHVSGHLKVAPEHLNDETLKKMRKPGGQLFERFREAFDESTKACGKQQYLVPYFISSFPGCDTEQMKDVEDFVRRENWKLQQVQDYIPLPMTAAAAMYYSGLDFDTEKPIFVARGTGARKIQRESLQPFSKGQKPGKPSDRPPRQEKKPNRRRRR